MRLTRRIRPWHRVAREARAWWLAHPQPTDACDNNHRFDCGTG
jgi:hypothetical protein